MFNEEEIRTEVFKQKPLDFSPQAYVTAAYVKVADQLLLLQLSNLKKEPNKWGVPAGRLEADELPEEGVRRELFEETSISIDPQTPIHSIGQLYIRRPGMDYIYHAFRVKLSHMPQVILSNEHIAYKWVSASEAKELPLMKGAKEALQFYLDSREETQF